MDKFPPSVILAAKWIKFTLPTNGSSRFLRNV